MAVLVLSVWSSADGAVTSAAVNSGVQLPAAAAAFSSFGWLPKVELLDAVVNFFFLRKLFNCVLQ